MKIKACFIQQMKQANTVFSATKSKQQLMFIRKQFIGFNKMYKSFFHAWFCERTKLNEKENLFLIKNSCIGIRIAVTIKE